jgi:hypothetical protein
MPGGSITQPGVQVIQEFVSESPTVLEPSLPTVIFGPAFQIVDAFDDEGAPQDEALAGTYRDGLGTVSYNLPSLLAEVALSGFESDVRTFLVFSDGSLRELQSESDELVLVDDGTGDFAWAGPTLTDASQLFLQQGVEEGDVVRFTFQGEVLDIPIAAGGVTDTVLTLEPNIVAEDLAGVTYDIVRNPAEFVFSASVQADAEYGTDADYLYIEAQEFKTDGITPADYRGARGDDLTVVFQDSNHLADGTLGAVGDSIFEAASGNFLVDVAGRGPAPAGFLVSPGGEAAGQVLRDVLAVIDGTRLIIETGEGLVTAQDWFLGTELGTGADGDLSVTTTFTTAGSTDFETLIGSTGGVGVGGPPVNTTYIELPSGTSEITNISADGLTLTLNTPLTNGIGLAYTIVDEVASGTTDSETKADTVFAHADVGVDLSAVMADDGTEAINVAGSPHTAAVLAAAVVAGDGFSATIPTATLAEGALLTWSAVEAAVPLSLSFDVDAEEVIIQLARAAGISSNTTDELVAAITVGPPTPDPAYNVVVADIITASKAGTGVTITEEDLPLSLALDGGADEDNLVLDADLLGSSTPTAQVYVSYKALRLDVSDQAANAALLSISDTTQLDSLLGPVTPDNPLALGVFYALINSPTRTVKALGVSDVTAAKPEGTLEAYISALEFLEGYDVYHMVPLTQDPTIHAALATHVDALSAPEQKSERIGFIQQVLPEYAKAEVIASGTSGNTAGDFAQVGPDPAVAPDGEFSTSVDLSLADVQENDILVVSANADSGTSPQVVNGTVGPLYGVRVDSVKVGDNFVLMVKGEDLTTDAEGAPGNLGDWNTLIDVSWTLYRPGLSISQPADQALEVHNIGHGFDNRRIFHHWPDEVTADVQGSEQILEGYYLACGWAGKGQEAPVQQGFTNTTVVGYTGLRHSNGYFSRAQLDLIAGGGSWITVQDSQTAPLKCRHQLSTDISSVQKREYSITKIIDYVAKLLRSGLENKIGKFNITQPFLDALSTQVEGLGRSLVESGVLLSFNIVNIGVNPTQVDRIDITVALGVPIPANYIVLTLQI